MDTIAGGYYVECPYAEIAEKLEKISRNNKAWSSRKSDTGRNTFLVQFAHNLVEEKVNMVNYLSKPPPLMIITMRRTPM